MTLDQDFAELTRALLRLSALDAPRMELLGLVSEALLDFSQADAVDLCLKERDRFFCVGVVRPKNGANEPQLVAEASRVAWGCCNAHDGALCPALLEGGLACARPLMPVSDTRIVAGQPRELRVANDSAEREVESTAVSPFAVSAETDGLMVVRSCRREWLSAEQTELYASLAGLLGATVAQQSEQRNVRMRARELAALYRIAQLVGSRDASLERTLSSIARAIPGGCSEPGRVLARIVIDGRSHGDDEVHGQPSVTHDLVLRGANRGFIQLGLETGASVDDEDALASAARLLAGVARQVATLVHRLELHGEAEASERRNRQADRLATVGGLASGLGHELAEPLSAIVGFTELLNKDPSLSQQAKRDLERIESASNHAREIVHRLTELARRSPSGWQQVQANQVVTDALSFVEQRTRSAQVSVRCELDPAVPVIIGDRTQICQVLVNLLRNAIQAMPNGGELGVRTSALPSGLLISVADNGLGMSEEVRARIFEPFFTTKSAREGTGLGLAVVHDIVSLHGGTIEVASTLGAGTRVEVRLPLTPPDLGAHPKEAAGGRDT